MKKALLSTLIVCATSCFSQEIDKVEFDKFDSVFKVTTKDVGLALPYIAKLIGEERLDEIMNDKKRNDSLENDPEWRKLISSKEAMEQMTKQDIYVKVGRFVSIKNKKAVVNNITVYAMITSRQAVVFDKGTSLKVLFEDGSVKEYKNEAPAAVYGEDEVATIFFTVPKSDSIRTKAIKSIRLNASKFNVDIETSNKSKNLISKMISLVESQPIQMQ